MRRYTILLFLFLSSLIVNVSYGQTKRQLDNEATFARLYGYIRYFHPSDEAAVTNWDCFAIYGSRKIENCKSSKELQDSLLSLFKPIAPTVQIYRDDELVTFNKAGLIPANPNKYKTIAWQHIGVGLRNDGGIYKSARTNRPVIIKTLGTLFAPFSKSIDAGSYLNKEFIFRSKVKLINGDGNGHLWARVDKKDKEMGFFDNMDDRPIISKEWKTYEIKGRIDSTAAFLHIGAFLSGAGELWVDDMTLEVNDKGEWKEVYRNTFLQEEGKAPQSINFSKTALNSYTFSVLQDVENGNKWVSVKSNDSPSKVVKHTTLFKQYPQVGEYVEKGLGSGLKAIIPLALYGSEEETYPATNRTELEHLQKALASIAPSTINSNNLYTRLGNLAIIWNIFQHFFPYFSIVKRDWNHDLTEAILMAYANKTSVDFQKTLQHLTAKLKDGHIRVNLSGNKAIYAPPVMWEWIEQQLVITNVADATLPLQKGDIVSTINGQKAEDYFNNINQYISAATKGWLAYRASLKHF